MQDLNEEYEEVRQEHYESLKERRFTAFETAKAKKLQVDWKKYEPGTFVFSPFLKVTFSETIFPWSP